jgi:hypothetical protein
MKSEENFLFGLFTHTSLGVSAFANHRGISPSPVGTLTRLMRSQEFLMLQLLYYKSTAIPSCKCVIKSNQSGSASREKVQLANLFEPLQKLFFALGHDEKLANTLS